MIYIDIEYSDYYFEYDDMKFYFSSQFYLNKFKREYSEFLKDETLKLKIKFKCSIFADYMILLLLYKKIEKRGFRVYYKNNRINENYQFDFIIN